MIVLVVFATARGDSESNTRALTFMTLVMSNLALILVNRSWTRIVLATLRSPNPAVWWVVGGDECRTAFVQHQALQFQPCVKVNVIQVKKRKQTGISPRTAQMGSEIHTLQNGPRAGGKPDHVSIR